jgi:hypothetical protein
MGDYVDLTGDDEGPSARRPPKRRRGGRAAPAEDEEVVEVAPASAAPPSADRAARAARELGDGEDLAIVSERGEVRAAPPRRGGRFWAPAAAHPPLAR